MFQSRGGGTSLATAVLEDEVLAEQGEEALSLLSGCRALLRSVTKVSLSSLLLSLLPLSFMENFI